MKTKVLFVLGILAVAAMMFTGCKDEPSTPAKKIAVTGVEIYIGNETADFYVLGMTGHDTYPDNVQLKAAITPSNATNRKVTWSKIDLDNAIDLNTTNGTVTATGPGEATVKVTTADGSFEDEITITVLEVGQSIVPIESVTIKFHDGIDVGPTLTKDKYDDDFTLIVEVLPAEDTIKSVTWDSSNKTVATISPQGVVTTLAAGKTTISATSHGKDENDAHITADFELTVVIKAQSVAIQISGVTQPSYNLGLVGHLEYPQTVQLTALVLPDDAQNKAIKDWVIKDSVTGIVTLEKNTQGALITAVGAGPVTVVVTTVDQEHENEIVITVFAVGQSETFVDSVTIKKDGVDVAKPLVVPFKTESIQLTADVLPTTATFDTVTWESSNHHVAEMDEHTHGLVIIKGAGDTIITATSVGNKSAAPNDKASDSFTLTVQEQLPPALVLYNMAASPSGSTTTVMPTMDPATKRWTITNAESGAGFTSAGTTNATIVYLDTNSTMAFQSISARVRIASALANNGSTGVIMGLMTNPEDIPTTTTLGGIHFGGFRATTDGAKRVFISRPTTNSNNSGILTVQNTSGYAEVGGSAGLDGVAIPFDEEFILEVIKISSGNRHYRAFLKDNATGTVIAQGDNNTAENLNITSPYLGFIIAGATVEISQIEIKEGALENAINDEIFTSEASTPIPARPVSVILTAPTIDDENAPDYTEIHPTLNGPSLTIGASILPARAPQNILWTIEGAASLSGQSNTGVTVNGLDTDAEVVVVTATAAGTEVKATLTITVTSSAVPLQRLTISESSNKDSIMAGPGGDGTGAQTLHFECEPHPHTATDKTFTWKVYDDETGTNEATIVAINSAGIMTITGTVTDPVVVWVAAIPTDTSVVTESENRLMITVKPYEAGPAYPLGMIRWGVSGSAAYEIDKGLVIKGNGTIDSSNFKMSMVYVKVPTKGSIYEAEVDIDVKNSSFGVTHNNSKMGIVVMIGNPATWTEANLQAYMAVRYNNLTNQPQSAVKNTGFGNNSNYGTAITSTTLVETLGIRQNASNRARPIRTQSIDGVAQTSYTDSGNRFEIGDDEDVYIGLIVSSNGSADVAQTQMTVKALRIRYPESATLVNIPLDTPIE